MRAIIPMIKEAFGGAVVPLSTKIAQKSSYTSEKPDLPFTNYFRYFEQIPQVQAGLTNFADLLLGTQINVNVEPGQEKAKELIEKWNDETKFFDKFRSVVITMMVTGVSLLEKLTSDEKIVDVLEVDMRSIVGKQRNDFGELLHYEQQAITKLIKLDPKNFIEFEYQNLNRAKWAIPPHHSLCVSRTVGNRTMPSVLDTMIATDDALAAIISNHAYPVEYHVFDSMDDKELEKQAELIRKHKPGDKRVVNREPKIVIVETKGDSKYAQYIERMDKVSQIGLQFPIEMLTGDFTSRASSDVSHTLIMQKVKSTQRNLSSKLKNELYDVILQQNGFDPQKIKLQISFGASDLVKLDANTILAMKNSNVITNNEAREYMKQHTDVDLFDTIADQKPAMQQEKCKMCKENQHALCTKRKCECDHILPLSHDVEKLRKEAYQKILKRLENDNKN